jgi:hypothetical protein
MEKLLSSQRFETFLARLYSDRGFRERFLAAPESVATEAGLDDHEQRAAVDIDRVGLLMAARSYELKRAGRARRGRIRYFAMAAAEALARALTG